MVCGVDASFCQDRCCSVASGLPFCGHKLFRDVLADGSQLLSASRHNCSVKLAVPLRSQACSRSLGA